MSHPASVPPPMSNSLYQCLHIPSATPACSLDKFIWKIGGCSLVLLVWVLLSLWFGYISVPLPHITTRPGIPSSFTSESSCHTLPFPFYIFLLSSVSSFSVLSPTLWGQGWSPSYGILHSTWLSSNSIQVTADCMIFVTRNTFFPSSSRDTFLSLGGLGPQLVTLGLLMALH